ncbi:hypothetical protein [Candidatus Phytoplasma solani]|uniref:hypothetical protein n=1 Tax=Candidatus Phytoplasma solani TaxID=69896 RepID=UPI00358F4B83
MLFGSWIFLVCKGLEFGIQFNLGRKLIKKVILEVWFLSRLEVLGIFAGDQIIFDKTKKPIDKINFGSNFLDVLG